MPTPVVKFIQPFTLVLLLLALLYLPACSNTPGNDDTAIQEKINEEFEKDQAGAALHATVDNGVVTVTGECTGNNCAEEIKQRLQKIQGVKEVETNIIAKE